MQIDRLRVKNFRCFEQREFLFDPALNVLAGGNGTGKTAVLESLAIAAGTWFWGIKGQSSPSIQRSDARLVGRSFHGETTYEDQYPVRIEARGSALGTDALLWCRELSTPRGKTKYAQAKDLIRLAERADAAVRAGEPVTLPVVAYYGAGRLWERVRDTKRRQPASANGDAKRETSRLVGYRDSIDRRLNPRDFARWMARQDQISYQREEDTLFYRLVRRATAGMIQDVVDVRFDKDREEVVAEFEDGRLMPFSMLSDGQRNVLALVGDLAVRAVRLNLPLGDRALKNTPGVVLIDEIGLHLHPTWQRRVVGDLRQTFPSIQFILTTHSPQVLGEVPPRHVVLLTERGSEHPDRAFGLDSNAVLETVMGAESQNEEVEEALTAIFSAVQNRDPEEAERLIRKLRRDLHEEHGVDYDPPDLRRAEAALSRVRLIGR